MPERKESPEHWYWKMKLAEELRKQGYTVEVEKDGADLAVEKDGKRIAVEIETGKSDVEANINRNLAAGCHEVIVVWLGARRLLPGNEKVRSVSLADFVRLLPLEDLGKAA